MYASAIGKIDIHAIIAAIGHLSHPHVHCLIGHMRRVHPSYPLPSFHGFTYSARRAAPRRTARVNPHVQIRGEFVSPSVPCIVTTGARGSRRQLDDDTPGYRDDRALARIDLNFFIYVQGRNTDTSLSPNQVFKEKYADYKSTSERDN